MDPKKREALSKVMDDLNDKYPESSVAYQDDAHAINVEAIPTGCLSLDHVFGCGGLPRGRVVEIFGQESGGKTTLALFVAAQVQKAGGVVAFVDAEHSFTKAYAEALGVNCDDLLLSQPFTGEDAFEIMQRLVNTGIVDLIIVDSVSALVPKVEREGDISDQNMALQARLLSKGLRVLTSEMSKNKTSIIFLNQVRESMQTFGYGPKTSSTGGRALKFYASVRLETKKIKTLKDSKDVSYGTIMSVTGVKNKVAAPNRVAELEVIFGKGINVEADVIEAAILAGAVWKEGNTFFYKNAEGADVKLGVGKDKAAEAIKNDKEAYDCLMYQTTKK